MRCSLAILAASLAAAPSLRAGEGLAVGEERVLLADGPGKGLQATPHVAFGKGSYLVVWREGWHGKGGKARIWAARADREGKVLDPGGIEVAPAKQGVQTNPRVAFGGGVFLVVWQDLRNGKDYDVLAARVSPEGKVLEARPIPVAAGPRTQALPDVASDGKNFVVVWQGLKEGQTKYRGYAAVVAADGRVLTALETGGGAPQPQVAWGGEHYLVVFGTETLYSARLGPEGKPLNPKRKAWDGQVVRTYRHSIFSVAGAPGTGWLVVNHRSAPDYWGWGGPGAMRCYLMTPEGRFEASLKPHVDRDKSPGSRLAHWLDYGLSKGEGATWPMGQSAVVWDGKQFVAVWQRHHISKKVMFTNCDLVASRVDGWKPLDSAGVPVAASGEEEKKPALASDGAGHLLCVYERHGADGRVRVLARALRTR